MHSDSLSEGEEDFCDVIQLTDTHLFASPDETFMGLKCEDSLAAVLDGVSRRHPSSDALLLTGDLAQDGSATAYRRLKEQVASVAPSRLWLAGNHDEPEHMHMALGEDAEEMMGPLQLGNWDILPLDSRVPGEVWGSLDEASLSTLRDRLRESERNGRHVLLCTHHNPVPVEAAWLQRHALKNPEALMSLLEEFSHVRAVLFGHIHQAMNVMHQGVAFLACPSTSVQFHPTRDDFSLDERAPGWRWLRLYADGRYKTAVCRVPMESS